MYLSSPDLQNALPNVSALIPNFPPFRHGHFILEMTQMDASDSHRQFMPLRPFSVSGHSLSVWELVCKTSSGTFAGGCAVTLPPGRGDFPSPHQAPHPVLGEWLSALRYTGHSWLECGPFSIAPGFPEEGVAELLWEGLHRLLRRNGVSFLVGIAPVSSFILDLAIKQGARALEPFKSEPAPQYFLFVS